jgi:hypothetical protein
MYSGNDIRVAIIEGLPIEDIFVEAEHQPDIVVSLSHEDVRGLASASLLID